MAFAGKVAAAGAAAVCVGAFLPWAQVSTAFGTVSKSGMSGDGVVTAAIGAGSALAMLIGVRRTARSYFVLGTLACVLAGVAAVFNFQNVSSVVDSVSGRYVSAEVGAGLYLTIGGAFVAVVAGSFAYGYAPTPSKGSRQRSRTGSWLVSIGAIGGMALLVAANTYEDQDNGSSWFIAAYIAFGVMLVGIGLIVRARLKVRR
jgi:hypothetical protein